MEGEPNRERLTQAVAEYLTALDRLESLRPRMLRLGTTEDDLAAAWNAAAEVRQSLRDLRVAYRESGGETLPPVGETIEGKLTRSGPAKLRRCGGDLTLARMLGRRLRGC